MTDEANTGKINKIVHRSEESKDRPVAGLSCQHVKQVCVRVGALELRAIDDKYWTITGKCYYHGLGRENALIIPSLFLEYTGQHF